MKFVLTSFLGGYFGLIFSYVEINFQYDEYIVKTAFIENFTRLIEWPETSQGYRVGVFGSNEFGGYLETNLHGSTIGQKRFEVIPINSMNDLRNNDLHIVYLSSNVRKELIPQINSVISGQVLVISDTEGFARAGSMINLLIVNDKVIFEINEQTLRGSGLKVSYHLYQYGILINQ